MFLTKYLLYLRVAVEWTAPSLKPFFRSRMDDRVFEFRCAECGEVHRGSPSFSYAGPSAFFAVPEAERDDRTVANEDFCIVDDEHFFVRAILEVPIHGVEEPFTWGVWVSQSKESFERYSDTFGEDQSGNVSFGWLEVTMPGYEKPEGGHLPCDVAWQEKGRRPFVVPHEGDHQLCIDVCEGISWNRAISLAQLAMHSGH